MRRHLITPVPHFSVEAKMMSQAQIPSSTVSPSEVLKRYKTIAVVGASKNPEKDAYTVPQYLKEHGYRIIPVNPTAN